ncbi:MAG: STAS domain-containing protein [Desulfobacterales bacterium]|jgi:anti-anti-sigma factor
MEIIQKEKNGMVCVTVKGRMEARLSPELERTIKAILKSGQKRLLFDLSALEYLRSSVLRVILSTVKTLNRKKGRATIPRLLHFSRVHIVFTNFSIQRIHKSRNFVQV